MKNKMRFCVGAILPILAVVVELLCPVFFFGVDPEDWILFFVNYWGYSYQLPRLFYLLSVIALSVVLMIGKPGLPTAIASGICVVTCLAAATIGRQFELMEMISMGIAMIQVLAFAALVLLALPNVTQKLDGLRALWFLPGAIYVLHLFAFVIWEVLVYGIRADFYTMHLVPMTVAFFFVGHWLGSPWKKQPAASAPVPNPGAAAPVRSGNPQIQMAYFDQLYRNGQISEQAYLDIRRQLTGQS